MPIGYQIKDQSYHGRSEGLIDVIQVTLRMH
jgi:hypothetical protein